MHKGMNSVFWGFVFLTLHINIGSFQVIPNFIVWGIITFGILRIYDFYENKNLLNAGRLASVTTLLSIIYFLSALNMKTIQNSYYMIVLTIALGVLELVIIYYLFAGLTDYFLLTKEADRVEYFTIQLRYLIIINLAAYLMLSFFVTFQINSLGIFSVGLALLGRIWLISLLNHLKRIIYDLDIENEPEQDRY